MHLRGEAGEIGEDAVSKLIGPAVIALNVLAVAFFCWVMFTITRVPPCHDAILPRPLNGTVTCHDYRHTIVHYDEVFVCSCGGPL